MERSTAHEYWQTVGAIAGECKELYPDPDDRGRHDYISESVDGSEWVISYHGNEIVLQESSNEPGGREVQEEMSNPDADWRQMRMIAASLAMEQDVWDALRELDKQDKKEDGSDGS